MLTVPSYGCASRPQILSARYGTVRRSKAAPRVSNSSVRYVGIPQFLQADKLHTGTITNSPSVVIDGSDRSASFSKTGIASPNKTASHQVSAKSRSPIFPSRIGGPVRNRLRHFVEVRLVQGRQTKNGYLYSPCGTEIALPCRCAQ